MKLASTGLETGLHKMIAAKQGHIAQMQAHHSLQRAWGYKKLAKHTKGRIDDERDHLKSTLHYMAQREVTPKMDSVKPAIGTDVVSQLTNDLENERQCVTDLNEFLSAARTANEDSLRRMIEHVVKDDEQHIADLEQQLNIIHTAGLENYLAKASKV